MKTDPAGRQEIEREEGGPGGGGTEKEKKEDR